MKNTHILICVYEQGILDVTYYTSYGSAYMQMVKELYVTLAGKWRDPDIYDKHYLGDFGAWSNTCDDRSWQIEEIDSGCDDSEQLASDVRNTILQFAFESGDPDCHFHQVFTVVQSDEVIDYAAIEDSLLSYIEETGSEDDEFELIVEDVLNMSGLSWSFMPALIPESQAIFTFWV